MDVINLSQFLGKKFTATIDRPIGSRHPEWGFEYQLNYGYIPGIAAPDGEDQDVYVMGLDKSILSFTGVCVAVIMRTDDVEGKLVLAADGSAFSRKQIIEAVAFQEQFFDSRVILTGEMV
jgi:inorganic pyrophosphatase